MPRVHTAATGVTGRATAHIRAGMVATEEGTAATGVVDRWVTVAHCSEQQALLGNHSSPPASTGACRRVTAAHCCARRCTCLACAASGQQLHYTG
jgi:hypothetical protein